VLREGNQESLVIVAREEPERSQSTTGRDLLAFETLPVGLFPADTLYPP